jgi:hypothetical protein
MKLCKEWPNLVESCWLLSRSIVLVVLPPLVVNCGTAGVLMGLPM